MRCKDKTEALAQAKANADRSGFTWTVFPDTNGVWNAERWFDSTAPKELETIVLSNFRALSRDETKARVNQWNENNPNDKIELADYCDDRP